MIRILQGIDLVTVSKIKKIMLDRPAFGEEVFTSRERDYCLARPDPFIHFAGRFAAKEACLKALGTGLSGNGIDAALGEVEVVPDGSGRPSLSVGGWTAKVANRKRVYQYTVSISHSGDYAVASVILASHGKEETGKGETA
ncbi:MAG: holo-ACP synthase [Syntrophobacteraceae bacterium]